MEEKVEETHCKLEVGSLHKKKNSKNWYYRRTINGKVIDLSTGTDDIDEAKKIANAKFIPITQATQEEVLAGHVLAARKLKRQGEKLYLDNAWDVYSKHPDRAMPATVSEQEAYKSTFNEFRQCVNDPKITVAEITHLHAEKFAEYMRGQSLSVETHNRKIKRLRRIFKVLSLYRDGDNPFSSSVLLRRTREDQNIDKRHQAFTKEQEQQILDELANPSRKLMNKEEIRLVYLLGMYTGQRLKDCVLLRWNCVSLKDKRIEVTQYKTGKQVTLPIAPPLLEGLEKALEWKEDDVNAYVCPKTAKRYNTKNHRGKNIGAGLVNLDVLRPIRWIGLQTSVKVEGRAHSITQYGFHSCRHAFISFCAEAGVPKSVVMSFVGADADIIDKYYTHVGADQQIRALETVFTSTSQKSDADKIREVLDYIATKPATKTLAKIKDILTS
ncbi:MAG: tyrosine-type recombinase/integrase [Victivallales bacterium]|nr:tyrosine-type recombinase/integrase [Victivallales bacterium]